MFQPHGSFSTTRELFNMNFTQLTPLLLPATKKGVSATLFLAFASISGREKQRHGENVIANARGVQRSIGYQEREAAFREILKRYGHK